MELSQGWRAVTADDELRRTYQTDDYDDAAWEPVTVPGHWRSTPAFAATDGPILARCRFEAPPPAVGRRAWLTFDGLFYQGDVWLDGSYLGDTEGYFTPHAFEVTEALRARDDHALAVEVTCSPERDPDAKRNITGAFQAGAYADPRGNPGGIWRPVRVTETGPVRIVRLRALCREADAQRAVMALRATLDSDDARTVCVRTELGGQDHELSHPLAAGTNEVEWTVTIERPALWWPRALGDPVLHDLRVAVLVPPGTPDASPGAGPPSRRGAPTGGPTGPGGAPAPGEAGALSDERLLRTGLRSVRMRRWVWSVNGERLFLKGIDMGPTRLALGDATPAELRADVDLAMAAGLDLIRMHGHVGRAETYDAADERGLLVWQDMPLRGPYARSVRRQAARQAGDLVSLLGHHPSIALWCGHDEPVPLAGGPGTARASGVPGRSEDGGTPGMGDGRGSRGGERRERRAARRALLGQQLPNWNKTVLDTSVKRALDRADGTRPVVAHSGVLPHLPQLDGTSTHLYLGWHHGDERRLPGLARAVPRLVRFVAEMGAQAVPSGPGAAFCEPERWPDLDWERLADRHGLEKDRFDRYVPPEGHDTFGSWRDATQAYQARVIRRQVEALRRLKYRPTGGFAVASLADPRPAVSCAVLDHERRPKLAYEALRLACRPVVVVADRLPEVVVPGQTLALDVHVVSDRREPVAGIEVSAHLSWPGDGHRWRWAGDAEADSCARVGTLQLVVPDTPGPLTLDLHMLGPDGDEVTNRYEATVGTAGDEAGGGGTGGDGTGTRAPDGS